MIKENAELKAKIAMYENLLQNRLTELENNQITVRKEYEYEDEEY